MDGITALGLLYIGRITGLSKNLARQDSFADICLQEEFHSILVCEKARADRNGHGFSLLTIEVSNIDDMPSLTERLQHLIRTTDEIGWFDNTTLGVLLYNTSALGAWQFVNKTRKKMHDGFSLSKCSVYSYPNEWCAF